MNQEKSSRASSWPEIPTLSRLSANAWDAGSTIVDSGSASPVANTAPQPRNPAPQSHTRQRKADLPSHKVSFCLVIYDRNCNDYVRIEYQLLVYSGIAFSESSSSSSPSTPDPPSPCRCCPKVVQPFTNQVGFVSDTSRPPPEDSDKSNCILYKDGSHGHHRI